MNSLGRLARRRSSSFSAVRTLRARTSASAACLYSSRSARMSSSLRRSSAFCSRSAVSLAGTESCALTRALNRSLRSVCLWVRSVPLDACFGGQGHDGELAVRPQRGAAQEPVHGGLDLAALIGGHRRLRE